MNIWITGASRGIGAAIAKKLFLPDNKIILSASNEDSFKDIRKTITDDYNIIFKKCDITKPDDITTSYSEIIKQVGNIDVLINNAGVANFKLVNDLSETEFDYMFNVNTKGIFLTIKAVLPEMLRAEKGIIININSVASLKTYTGSSVYSASKAAALAISRTLREEVRQSGIKVIDIFPGAVNTDIWSDNARKKHGDVMLIPEDVAEVVREAIELSKNGRLMLEEIVLRPQNGDL
ncbi:MAG: Dehydrogenase [Ignavibacteria bacterium]|nr:Dehydrogenase [Ignavibacteria bacterium]